MYRYCAIMHDIVISECITLPTTASSLSFFIRFSRYPYRFLAILVRKTNGERQRWSSFGQASKVQNCARLSWYKWSFLLRTEKKRLSPKQRERRGVKMGTAWRIRLIHPSVVAAECLVSISQKYIPIPFLIEPRLAVADPCRGRPAAPRQGRERYSKPPYQQACRCRQRRRLLKGSR